MYNSRSRRGTGYDGYKRSFTVPENYSGNAFRDDAAQALDDEPQEPPKNAELAEEIEEVIEEEAVPTLKKADDTPKRHGGGLFQRAGFGFDVGRLFKGGFGFEELLIIGLILLISESENNEDMIALLALLLFVS